MVFNVVARNCDDHTKNFAFLLREDRAWTLAPAYDICYAYRPGSIWVSQHALSIGGKRKDFERADLEALAASIGSKSGATIVDEILAVVGAWPAYARRFGVEGELEREIGAQLSSSRRPLGERA